MEGAGGGGQVELRKPQLEMNAGRPPRRPETLLIPHPSLSTFLYVIISGDQSSSVTEQDLRRRGAWTYLEAHVHTKHK